MNVPAWLRDVRRITAEREIDHDEYCDADEVRERCAASWWAGCIVGVSVTSLVAFLLWAARLI